MERTSMPALAERCGQLDQIAGTHGPQREARFQAFRLAHEGAGNHQVEPLAVAVLTEDRLTRGKTHTLGGCGQQISRLRRAFQQLRQGVCRDDLSWSGSCFDGHIFLVFGPAACPWRFHRVFICGVMVVAARSWKSKLVNPATPGWMSLIGLDPASSFAPAHGLKSLRPGSQARAKAASSCARGAGLVSGGTHKTGTRERARSANAVP
jgi:hypothetical protein